MNGLLAIAKLIKENTANCKYYMPPAKSMMHTISNTTVLLTNIDVIMHVLQGNELSFLRMQFDVLVVAVAVVVISNDSKIEMMIPSG